MKKKLYSLVAIILLVGCFSLTAHAAINASGRFTITVGAGELRAASTGFPMAAWETVTINATYSPASADVDFGLVDRNGTFYHLAGENGVFSKTIEIAESGTYIFAVRNNSNVSVAITGFVNY